MAVCKDVLRAGHDDSFHDAMSRPRPLRGVKASTESEHKPVAKRLTAQVPYVRGSVSTSPCVNPAASRASMLSGPRRRGAWWS